MAELFWRKQTLIGKAEATYGVDPVPTGAANGVEASDVRVTFQGTKVTRAFLVPYFGAKPSEIAARSAQLTFDIDWQGAGAAGDLPAYDPFLRACTMASDVTEDVDVQYAFSSDNPTHESVCFYWNVDGNNHIFKGSKGTASIVVEPSGYIKLRFTFTGLYMTPAAVTLPDPDLSGWIAPLLVGPEVTTLSFFGTTHRLHRMELVFGNTVTPRHLVNYRDVQVTDRVATLSITIDAVPFGTLNPYALADAKTTGALQLQHGNVAGRIVMVNAGKLQIANGIEVGQADGVTTWTLPCDLLPTDGDDELLLTVK